MTIIYVDFIINSKFDVKKFLAANNSINYLMIIAVFNQS